MNAQALLQALNNIQPNAQSALPVIPNNGNPNGAYNAPKPVDQPAVATSAPQAVMPSLQERFPWLQSSPSMELVKKFLDSKMNGMKMATPMQPVASPEPPVQPQQRSFRDAIDYDTPVLPINRYRMVP